jgi:hypothetical protein
MKKTPALLLAVFLCNILHAQQVFFKSGQDFNKDNLKSFFSSIAIYGDLLLFNANDYNLYAYNKNNGSLKWSSSLSYKTNTPAFLAGNKIWVGYYTDNHEFTAVLDTLAGKVQQVLPFGPVATKPVVKNDILFTSAIFEGGCLIAYDLKKDTVVWSRFLAHGFSTQPYYFDNRIQANAEANNWVSIDYDGRLTDTACKVKAEIFVPDVPCINKFYALTHDKKEIGLKFFSKTFGEDPDDLPLPLLTEHQTFILHNSRLVVLGDKLKIKATIELGSLSDTVVIDSYDPGSIVKANDEKIWVLHSNQLFVIDQKTKKADRIIDLSAWEPHRVLIDENRLWMISRKEGLLYGLQL